MNIGELGQFKSLMSAGKTPDNLKSFIPEDLMNGELLGNQPETTNQLPGTIPMGGLQSGLQTGFNAPQADGSFVDTLKQFMGDVNTLGKESADLQERMLKGEPVEIHDVMIAAEKSKTAFQLLVEVRNKFLDVYREVSRMQV